MGRGRVQRVSEWAGRGVDFAGVVFCILLLNFSLTSFSFYIYHCVCSLYYHFVVLLVLYGVNRICRPNRGPNNISLSVLSDKR